MLCILWEHPKRDFKMIENLTFSNVPSKGFQCIALRAVPLSAVASLPVLHLIADIRQFLCRFPVTSQFSQMKHQETPRRSYTSKFSRFEQVVQQIITMLLLLFLMLDLVIMVWIPKLENTPQVESNFFGKTPVFFRFNAINAAIFPVQRR